MTSRNNIYVCVCLLLTHCSVCCAFQGLPPEPSANHVPPSNRPLLQGFCRPWISSLSAAEEMNGISRSNAEKNSDQVSLMQHAHHSQKWIATLSLWITFTTASSFLLAVPNAAHAYKSNDYASETVLTTVEALKNSRGNVGETLKAYETLADIIAQGTGIGGAINYKGVQLERGYVADEDTTIYDPGLTLLTESEKERLLEAVILARKAGLSSNWNDDAQLGFDFLRQKLDPLHMNELRGYLQVLPFYSAVVYLIVLAVQQLARPAFAVAYLVGVVAIFGPALALVALGPQ